MPNTLARRLRKTPTRAEGHLWTRLRRRQLAGCQFRRQAPIGRYVVDFVCFPRKLIVEVDGGQHAWRQFRDSQRTEWLETQGFQVIRFWNNDVLQNTEQVLEVILETLTKRGTDAAAASPRRTGLASGMIAKSR